MPPQKKVKSTLANCRTNPKPSTSASIPSLLTAPSLTSPSLMSPSSTSSDPENPESNLNKRKRVHLGPWYKSHWQRLVPGLEMYSLSSCIASVVNTTLDTLILRPNRVDVAWKLLVDYHIGRRVSFLSIDFPSIAATPWISWSQISKSINNGKYPTGGLHSVLRDH